MRSTRSTEHRRARRYAAACLALLLPLAAAAHSPHHIVTDVAVERAPDAEADAFILITDQVFRSTDRDSPWKNLDNGLDIRHPYVSVELSPEYRSDRTLYVATSGDGVFRSTDGGESWRRINEGLGSLVLSDLHVSRAGDAGQRLLAAGADGGLWLRDDEAGRWTEVLAPHVSVTALAASGSDAGAGILYAGDAGGRLWRSSNGGALWQVVDRLDGVGAITSIAASGESLYAGTSGNGLYLAEGAGAKLRRLARFEPERTHDCRGRELDEPVPDRHVTSIGLSPDYGADRTLYVTTWYGAVFVSRDAGSTWTTWSDGLSCDPQAAAEGLPHYSAIEFGEPGDGIAWLAAFDGLFRAESAGGEWRQLETLPLGLIKGFAVDDAQDRVPAVALATYGGGFYLSKDVGENWLIGNRGLVTTRLTGIAFSPETARDSRIYAGASQRLLFSDDSGRSWQRVNLQDYGFGAKVAFKLWSWGVPRRFTRVLHDPRDYSLVYPTHIVARTRPSTGRVLFATRFHGVMAFEPDSGDVESVWSGTDKIMNTFESSPYFADDRTLYGSIRSEGVVRSTDGGASFTKINDGLDFVDEWARNADATNFRRDVQLAVSPAFNEDNVLFAGSPAANGLYRSDDGGDRWRRVELLPEAAGVPVLAIALSPGFNDGGPMLVSVKGHGLYRSTNGGRTFEAVGESLRRDNASLEFLACPDSGSGDTLCFGASDEDLYVSRDAGTTWRPVRRPVRYEDMRDVVRFGAGWEERGGPAFSAMTERRSTRAGASVELTFFGTGFRWMGSVGPEFGTAKVFVDGRLVDSVDASRPEQAALQTLVSVENLPFGRHDIEVRVEGDDGPVAVDAFDILGSSGAAR